MTGHRGHIALLTAGALALTGCGGGKRQDADEAAGTYTVDVVRASFPTRQKIARPTQMRIAVKNTGTKAVPDVAVTVDSFTRRSQQPGQADPERPIWIVDEGPRGRSTADVGTWALNRLKPGQTKIFTWKVTAVDPGHHVVKWTVAAGLDGKAKARTASGEAPTGSFDVDVSPAPSSARVDPETGAVIREGEGS